MSVYMTVYNTRGKIKKEFIGEGYNEEDAKGRVMEGSSSYDLVVDGKRTHVSYDWGTLKIERKIDEISFETMDMPEGL